MENLPYASYPIEWDGDGPSQFGAAPSDAQYGEQELVAIAFSMQPVRVWTADDPAQYQFTRYDAAPNVPESAYDATILQAPAHQAAPGNYTNPYQDTLAGIPSATYTDIYLGAPDLALGGD